MSLSEVEPPIDGLFCCDTIFCLSFTHSSLPPASPHGPYPRHGQGLFDLAPKYDFPALIP